MDLPKWVSWRCPKRRGNTEFAGIDQLSLAIRPSKDETPIITVLNSRWCLGEGEGAHPTARLLGRQPRHGGRDETAALLLTLSLIGSADCMSWPLAPLTIPLDECFSTPYIGWRYRLG